MRFRLSFWPCLLSCWLLAGTAWAQRPSAAAATFNPAQWAPELRAFARQDSVAPPPANSILFYGSSSVRKWETLAQDFPGRPVLNRGFGGSRFPDAIHFFDQLVLAYRPRQVVLYEGDNDMGAGATPEEVLQVYVAFDKRLRQQLPRTALVFLAIKPSPSRWALYPQVARANALIREYIRQHPQRRQFVDVATPMLGADGKPRPELYTEDNLHMTRAGYALWAKILEPYLLK